tara:strand:- start:1780 stop:2118 length:339 start_codon:yes stop_codon:yes gene_type:complete
VIQEISNRGWLDDGASFIRESSAPFFYGRSIMRSALNTKYDPEWETGQIQAAIDYYSSFFEIADRFDAHYLEIKISELECRITQLRKEGRRQNLLIRQMFLDPLIVRGSGIR